MIESLYDLSFGLVEILSVFGFNPPFWLLLPAVVSTWRILKEQLPPETVEFPSHDIEDYANDVRLRRVFLSFLCVVGSILFFLVSTRVDLDDGINDVEGMFGISYLVCSVIVCAIEGQLWLLRRRIGMPHYL